MNENQSLISLALIGTLLVLIAAAMSGCAEIRRVGSDQYSLGGVMEAKDFYERQARQGGGSAE